MSKQILAGATRTMIEMPDAIDTLPAAARLRDRTYRLFDLADGDPVVDVGCGTGRAVAELNATGRRAVGVDHSASLLGVARDRWPDADLRPGDAYALPFADRSLAGYRADKVFHELDDPARALAEARRILAPSGRIVLLGHDWDGVLVDASNVDLTRRIVYARADAVTDPFAARRYRAGLLDAGFTDVVVEGHCAILTNAAFLPLLDGLASTARGTGTVGDADAEAWRKEMAERARTDRLFMALPVIVAHARA